MTRNTRNGTAGFLLFAIAAAVCPVLSQADEPEETGVFDQEEYDWYWAAAVSNLDGLIERFDAQRWDALPIYPPGDTHFWQTGSPFPLPVDLAAFPEDFTKGLVGVDYGGFYLYPVYIVEDEETRALFLLNADSDPLGAVAAPDGYDWQEELQDRLPWCFPDGMSPEEEQARFAELDPARLGLVFWLIPPEGLVALCTHDEGEEQSAESKESEGFGLDSLEWTGGSVTNIVFTAIDAVSNGARGSPRVLLLLRHRACGRPER